MEKEDQIIEMLGKIISKQDEHSQTLKEHGHTLKEHSQILKEHSQILKEHSQILKGHGQILDSHTQKHEEHTTQFKEHGQILSALRSGQDYLKAEIDGMKIANVKEFGDLKEEISIISTNQELLGKDTWANRVDIHRIKNMMGMK